MIIRGCIRGFVTIRHNNKTKCQVLFLSNDICNMLALIESVESNQCVCQLIYPGVFNQNLTFVEYRKLENCYFQNNSEIKMFNNFFAKFENYKSLVTLLRHSGF